LAQVDGISVTDLVMAALENHVATRRQAEDFKANVQAALAEAEAQMARTRATLLGTLPEGTGGEGDATSSGRSRRKDEASG
jgi:hypothetical protein